MVIDCGEIVKKLMADFLLPEDSIWIVPVPPEFSQRFSSSGIEDLFTKDDFRMLLDVATIEVEDRAMEKQPNSRVIGPGSKVLVAKACLELAMAGELQMGETTRRAFGSLLEFCSEKDNWYRL